MSPGIDELYLEDGKQVSVWFMDDRAKEASKDGTLEKCRDAVRNIPMFVSFPKGENAGTVRRDLVNSCDILPTCLEAAGAEPIKCDGRSMYRETNREYTFAEGEGFIAVTDGRYKYVHVQKGNENFREFTDTVRDPNEFLSFIGDEEYAPVVSRLREKIIEHFMGKLLP